MLLCWLRVVLLLASAKKKKKGHFLSSRKSILSRVDSSAQKKSFTFTMTRHGGGFFFSASFLGIFKHIYAYMYMSVRLGDGFRCEEYRSRRIAERKRKAGVRQTHPILSPVVVRHPQPSGKIVEVANLLVLKTVRRRERSEKRKEKKTKYITKA